MHISISVSAFAALALVASTGLAETPIDRGRYLVEQISVCGECHTPRDWKGTLKSDRWLQGNTLDFAPTRRMPWAAKAPAIAGLPGFATDEVAIRYFETGLNAAGKRSNPPMPQYRFSNEDAKAVVAYLRSLGPGTNAQPKLDTSQPRR